MQEHFIHYLKRKIIVRKPQNQNSFSHQEAEGNENFFERPLYHATRRSSGAVTRIRENSVIWLFSVVESPWGILAPSLDAKFVVEKIEQLSDGSTLFYADKDSCWFPLADASSLLGKLNTIDSNGIVKHVQTDNKKAIGIYLQSIRQLSNAQAMVEWSERILNSKFDFISYRIKDGTKPAFHKVKNLLQDEKIVFWDRFSLPRRLAERREHVAHEALDTYLMKKIKEAACVWGIESPLYGDVGSYALKEAQESKQQQKYFSVDTSAIYPKRSRSSR